MGPVAALEQSSAPLSGIMGLTLEVARVECDPARPNVLTAIPISRRQGGASPANCNPKRQMEAEPKFGPRLHLFSYKLREAVAYTSLL